MNFSMIPEIFGEAALLLLFFTTWQNT